MKKTGGGFFLVVLALCIFLWWPNVDSWAQEKNSCLPEPGGLHRGHRRAECPRRIWGWRTILRT